MQAIGTTGYSWNWRGWVERDTMAAVIFSSPFATGNHLPRAVDPVRDLSMLTHVSAQPLFDAVAEVVEEAILNALCSAETMTGYLGRMVYALPQDDLIAVMRDYGRLQKLGLPQPAVAMLDLLCQDSQIEKWVSAPTDTHFPSSPDLLKRAMRQQESACRSVQRRDTESQ